MDGQDGRRSPHTTDVGAGLQRAAGLARSGLVAFLEGNPFRGRRVQEGSRELLSDMDAWQERALASWTGDEGEFERELALARHVDALARTAQQLAALAESRPSSRVQVELRDAVRRLSEPLDAHLASLEGSASPLGPTEALGAVLERKAEFVAWCARLGRDNPRMFSSCLLAVAAGQRIEEAAEAVTEAASLRALLAVA